MFIISSYSSSLGLTLDQGESGLIRPCGLLPWLQSPIITEAFFPIGITGFRTQLFSPNPVCGNVLTFTIKQSSTVVPLQSDDVSVTAHHDPSGFLSDHFSFPQRRWFPTIPPVFNVSSS